MNFTKKKNLIFFHNGGSFITKWDSFNVFQRRASIITKRGVFFVLQSRASGIKKPEMGQFLLQNGVDITERGNFYYKVGQVLQKEGISTRYGSTFMLSACSFKHAS